MFKHCMFVGWLILAASCGRYEYYSEDPSWMGKFALTTHMRIDHWDWEGGNTESTHHELCNSVSGECFVDDSSFDRLRNEKVFHASYSPDFQRIAVYSNNSTREDAEKWLFRIFDAATAIEFPCLVCDGNYDFHGVLGSKASIKWVRSDLLLFMGKEHKSNGSNANVFLIRIVDAAFTISQIGSVDLGVDIEHVSWPGMDAAGQRLAWAICERDCRLIVTDIASGARVDETVVACSKGFPIDVEWRSDQFAIKCMYGASVVTF